MRAYEHTGSMLNWWRGLGIKRADLAIKLPRGMIWHHNLPADALPLAWARSQNAHHGEVYIRPARGYAWPVVFLDDVPVPLARSVAHKYDALVVDTSPAGGCHIWLACDWPLPERSRCKAQRWLAQCINADLGSVSGEHLGRLAGFKNWKRAGTWVNVLVASCHGQRWNPAAASLTPTDQRRGGQRRLRRRDTTPSGREWGWVCGMIEAGCSPEKVHHRLVEHARRRRGSDVERYAQRTLQRALEHTRRNQ